MIQGKGSIRNGGGTNAKAITLPVPSEIRNLMGWAQGEAVVMTADPIKGTVTYSKLKDVDFEKMTDHEVFQNLCRPLVNWLYDHGTPHDYILISQTFAEHVQSRMGVPYTPRD